MVNRNLLRQFDLPEGELQQEWESAFSDESMDWLPAEQRDIRRPPEIGHYPGKELECKIITIAEARRNIVVSRRQLLEDQREEMKKKLLSEIQPGQIRQGIVRNIAPFGAFVDLGGI